MWSLLEDILKRVVHGYVHGEGVHTLTLVSMGRRCMHAIVLVVVEMHMRGRVHGEGEC